ncbi:M1 family aminopeptidase [Planctomyces sp. SH-PL62]|uniref:M1 family aminopeptidase n=1 Tax=Planctomyces sp. SH-PL62 TaxID=1636152 RepID=UPI00078C18B7|nr:M1 family aminopeptidase [Planctomyces sp. SH-PL62]AMV40654.1 Aminopeptidase N [Planctomyces sp. SH-PL62]
MLSFSRRSFLAACLASTAALAFGQAPVGQARKPFAKPGTPRKAERIRSYDVKHIRADLKLDLEKGTIAGTVAHTIAPLHAPLARLELDCGPRLKVERATLGAAGVELPFEHKGETLAITIEPPRPAGEEFVTTIAYSGATEQGLHFIPPDAVNPDRPRAAWTQGEAEETRYWLPCYDSPNDPATTEMVVTVARPYSVVSNGALAETTENPDGTRTFHWKMEQPHSSYLITIAASEFNTFRDHVGDLPVEYHVLKNVDEETARRFMGKTPRMIEFFSEATGQPYPYPKYAQVCLPEFNGGMENTSATSMTDDALLDRLEAQERDMDGLVAHELAHQWFGDLMTCKDWSHLWLNEGFASYFDPLFAEHELGDDEFRLQMRAAQQGYLGADRMYRRPIVEPRYENPIQLFDGMSYAKGASVLHALRGTVGDEGWWKGIKRYVAANKFRNVESDDLRKAFEAATGKDLGWFFDQWVYKAGHPELKASWRYEPEDATVRLKVEQVQKLDEQTPLFRLPTTVEIVEAPGRSKSVAIVVDGPTHEFVIPAGAEPKAVLLDPQGWIPKELMFERPVAENLFLLEHGPNVLARLDAAEALAKKVADHPEARTALAAAWSKEKRPDAAVKLLETLKAGDEANRATLVSAAESPEARVRAAAVRGLAALPRDDASEALLREVWNDPEAPYGARRAALRGLVTWKVADAEKLADAALDLVDGRHVLAATALGLALEQPGARARELAAAYLAPGRPPRLRYAALQAMESLAKDDAGLQDLIVPLAEDADRGIRTRAWGLIRTHRIQKALPVLENRLKIEDFGFNAGARNILEAALKALKEAGPEAVKAPTPPAAAAAPAPAPEPWAEIQKQVDELERQLRELRKKIEERKAG